MAISFVNSAKAGSATVTLPTGIGVNDLIILFGYRNTTTAPSLPAGYTNITNQSANTNSMRVCYKVADGTESGTTVTMTNANVVQCAVYRGCYLVGAAGSTTNAASTTTNLSASGAFVVTDNSSWGVYGCGSRQITSQTTPAGTTLRGAVQAGTTSIALICDTNGGVTSNGAKTSTAGSAVTGAGWSFELVATKAASTLFDDFNDNSIAAQWDPGANNGGTTLETNQELEITPGAPGVDSECYMDSGGFTPKWDLTSDRFMVQLKQVFTDLVNTEALLHVIPNDHNGLYFDLHGSPLMIGTGYVALDVDHGRTDTAYNPAIHKWLQIRESGGTIFWEVSATGQPGSWTTLDSLANPFSIRSLYFKFQAFSFSGSTGGVGTIIFDNFNVAPPAAVLGDFFNLMYR